MDRLTLATRIWAREYGQKIVNSNDLIDLFDLLLIHEQTALGGVDFTLGGKPKYLHYSYLTAVEPVLEQCEHVKKKWEYRDYDPKMIKTSEQTKDLLLIVFDLLYKE
jgi:hypothetical protein